MPMIVSNNINLLAPPECVSESKRMDLGVTGSSGIIRYVSLGIPKLPSQHAAGKCIGNR
jgi:hypothetical protein